MIIQCPDCTTRYELDASRVPEGRIRVRCARCAYVFPIEAEAPVQETEAAAPQPDFADEPVQGHDDRDHAPEAPADDVVARDDFEAPQAHEPVEAEPMVGMESTRIEDPATPELEMDPGLDLEIERPEIQSHRHHYHEPQAQSAPVAPQAATATATEAPARTEGAPADQKARRLARALVSDILVYNREKRDKALADGTLVQALGQEIKKSWELYKERVTPEVASGTNHFKDALNDILAEGQKIF